MPVSNVTGHCVAGLLATLLLAISAVAQTTDATLIGTVYDANKGVLPGVTVTVTNMDAGTARSTVTDGQGRYRVPALKPGRYEIQAELSGFATLVRSGLTLSVTQEASIDLELQLAGLEQSVSVTAEAPLVDVSNSKIGTVITNDQLDSLPLLGRDFSSLAALAPGVAAVGGGGVTTGAQRATSNTYLLDGTNNDSPNLGGPRGAISLEAVQEFVVIANQYSAEYGQASGAIVSAVTRSGTNVPQGRIFTFIRDKRFNSNNPLAEQLGGDAPYSEQRYGGYFGGPIIPNRMHVFVTEEGYRVREYNVITAPAQPPDQRIFPQPTDQHQPFARVDYRLNNDHSLWFRYRMDRRYIGGTGIGGQNLPSRGINQTLNNQDATVNHVAVLTSRMLNEFRFVGGLRNQVFDSKGWAEPFYVPTISRPSGTSGGSGNGAQQTFAPSFFFTENLTYTKGNHSLKFGAEVQLYRGWLHSCGNGAGNFTFNTDAPFDPAVATTYPRQFTQTLIPDYPTCEVKLPNTAYVLFAQESWRPLSNVTLNLGLRYDTDNAWTDITGMKIDDRNNFAPRLGAVWDPAKDGKTAIRGGFGVYVDQTLLNLPLNVIRGQIWKQIIITNPGYPDPYSRPGAVVAPQRTVVQPGIRTPESYSSTLGVKREILKGIALSVDGVYTRGYKQQYSLDLNPTVNGVRPDPNWARIEQYSSGAETWYQALLVGLERRGGGPQYGASYTWAKAESESAGQGSFPQDGVNIHAERGPTSGGRRHQLVAHATWLAPYGIQVATILQARSGTPYNITTGIDNNGDGSNIDRPDLVNPNGSCTDKATFSSAFTGRVGNLPRNYCEGSGFATLDLRLSKFFRLGPSYKLEIFGEAYNLTNRSNFGNPTSNLNNANFGRVTSLSGQPRQVEFGFRLDIGGSRNP